MYVSRFRRLALINQGPRWYFRPDGHRRSRPRRTFVSPPAAASAGRAVTGRVRARLMAQLCLPSGGGIRPLGSPR
jgi:hypothetical protein